MKDFPIGIQNFEKLITEGYLYIDKTKYIHKLINTGAYFFLSRPRRFGKSLLISTLKAIYSGKQELFEGLWIHQKIEWQNYPIIHIDFSKMNYKKFPLEKVLSQEIDRIASEYSINLRDGGSKDKMGCLIEKLSENGKVVILIDEYDKPIIDFLHDIEQAEENRDILKNFYSIIKPSDPYLKFVLLTGVSKFSKVSVFSDLNNLNDITIDNTFATMLGYTQPELENYFEKHISVLAKTENISAEKLLEKIKTWYNGYSWNGKDFVYNPFSILNLFYKQAFGNYWFATGTPTFLINHIKQSEVLLEDLDTIDVLEYTFNKFELRDMDTISLLFQTGYLTIKSVNRSRMIYRLSYPNYEVKNSFLYSLFSDITKTKISYAPKLIFNLENNLIKKDIDSFFQTLQSLFASIPYNIFLEKEEAYYHSVIYLVLSLLGLNIDCEIQTNKGRIDAVIELKETIYIMEFKLESAKAAIEQIKAKKYHEKYSSSRKKIILIGVGFGIEEKNISNWEVENISQ